MSWVFPQYLVEGAHPRDGADVVGDGYQGGLREVLLADRLPLLLAHHVPKTAKKGSGLKAWLNQNSRRERESLS